MPLVQLKPNQLGRELRALGRALPKAVKRGLRKGAMAGKTYLVAKTPTDMGQLKASWVVTRGGRTELRNDAPHAGVIEGGARPHKVSRAGRESIYEWARRHFMYTTTVTRGVRKGQQSKPRRIKGDLFEDPFLTGITMAIVKKLEREGQEPTFFVLGSLPSLKRLAQREVEREFNKMAGKRAADRRKANSGAGA